MLSKDTKCTKCRKQKPTQQLPEEEQAAKQTTQTTQKLGMKLSKVEGEMTGRLLLGSGDVDGDLEMESDAYQMPEETKKLMEEKERHTRIS